MGLDTRGPESSRHSCVRRHSDTDSYGRDEALDYQRAEGATLTRRCHPSPSTVQAGTFTFNQRLVGPCSYTLASSLATRPSYPRSTTRCHASRPSAAGPPHREQLAAGGGVTQHRRDGHAEAGRSGRGALGTAGRTP
jgi:hypothetical protein